MGGQSNKYWLNLIAEIQKDIRPSATRNYQPILNDLAQYIDHTLLKLDTTPAQIDTLCDEAIEYSFKTVCVRLQYVEQAAARLRNGNRGRAVGVCCVVGFHEGTYSVEEKVQEAKAAIQAGATELDFVVNYPMLKQQQYESVSVELQTLCNLTPRVSYKLILETSQLTAQDVVAGTILAYFAGFEFVKTSTGFNGHGAKAEDVQRMIQTAEACSRHRSTSSSDLAAFRGREMHVKASGGVRRLEDAEAMIKAGAMRLGVSAGVSIVEQAKIRYRVA